MDIIHYPNVEFIGIEIGGTKLQVAVGTAPRIIERRHFQVDAPAGGEGIRTQLASVLPELIKKYSPLGIGVGFGGPVDWTTGQIRCSHQIAGWADFSLKDWLTAQTGLPVHVDNDANVAALGESLHGASNQFSPLFYITLGSGVGGGLVVDGKIYHGASPGETEIGHLRLDCDGTTVESACSGWSVDRRIRKASNTHPESVLFKFIGSEKNGEARHLVSALEMEDPLALQILRETTQSLAFALSHVVHLMHPKIIILGGGLSLMGEPLREAVAEALPAFVMSAFQSDCRVALASLKEDAVPIGALSLAATLTAGADVK